MKTFIFANTKGGVTKSHMAYHAVQYLLKKGKKVLCLDLDEQSNLVDNLQVQGDTTLLDVIASNGKMSITKCIHQRGNMYCAYSDRSLRSLDMYILTSVAAGREVVLHNLLKNYYDKFDYCIVDTPSNINLTTTNAFALPNVNVIIPVTLYEKAVEGVYEIKRFIETYNENMNREVKIHKVVICKDQVEISKHAQYSRRMLEEMYPDKLAKANFPHSIYYVNSASMGLSIDEYCEEYKVRNADKLSGKLNILFNEIL